MPTYTGGLAWSRSDGDPSTWPSGEELKSSNIANWWRKCEPPNDKIDLYETKVGKAVADVKGVKGESSEGRSKEKLYPAQSVARALDDIRTGQLGSR